MTIRITKETVTTVTLTLTDLINSAKMDGDALEVEGAIQSIVLIPDPHKMEVPTGDVLIEFTTLTTHDDE